MKMLLLVFMVFGFTNIFAEEAALPELAEVPESDENVELSLDQESIDEMKKNSMPETVSGSLPEISEAEENEMTLSTEDIDPALEPTRNHASEDSSESSSESLSSEAETPAEPAVAEVGNETSKPVPPSTTEQVLVETKSDVNEPKKVEETVTSSATTIELGEVSGTQKYKITCVLNDDVREITAITQADGSVGIVYKKFDSIKTIAIAKKDSPYADQVAEKIQNNLANGTYPYTCTKE